jgi:hypothetical protein
MCTKGRYGLNPDFYFCLTTHSSNNIVDVSYQTNFTKYKIAIVRTILKGVPSGSDFVFICLNKHIKPSTNLANGTTLFALQHLRANQTVLQTNCTYANAESFTIDMSETGRSFAINLFNEHGQRLYDVSMTLLLAFEEIM